MHNLTAHHSSWEPAFFVTHYIDGLQRDIRAAVVLHHLVDLVTAVDLALLQEEVLDSCRREARRTDYVPGAHPIPRMALPLLPPPGQKPLIMPPPTKVDERRVVDPQRQQPQEDKIAALRAYRRARGLCFTYGERWGRVHRCGPTVQLHVVEELLAMVQGSESEATQSIKAESEGGSNLMHLSAAAVEGSLGAKSMRLQGWIQNQEVLLLVDSGSSHTFISAELADKLSFSSRIIKPLRVKVANGGLMLCNTELMNCSWWTQGVQFQTNFKVLPLGSYDIILGFDWLNEHSPMIVHWGNQTMSFDLHGKTVHLEGVQTKMTDYKPVSMDQLQSLLQHSRVARVVQLCLMKPDDQQAKETKVVLALIQRLLAEFRSLFEEPSELPPQQQFDHAIPLCPGAKPIN